jgi:hypothetical protein
MNIFELVIAQIKEDLAVLDETALSEMLVNVPQEILVGYLNENRYATPVGIVSTSKWLEVCNEEQRR